MTDAIEEITMYRTSNGRMFETLAEAVRYQNVGRLEDHIKDHIGPYEIVADDVARYIADNLDAITTILNGGTPE